ncbi:hypothetical protein JW865_03695 [Candidatus Bathyarchaeota archaeon]|nr:hypothetical protein [Candidatus Bathyarchaeota archaeon]
MSFEVKEWGNIEKIGKGYGFNTEKKFYAILETKKGSYRGNHTHPNNQYTLLLSGDAKYIVYLNEEIIEKTLKKGEIFKVEAEIPHIMVPETDIITFEWWDGDFIAKNVNSIFDKYTLERIGPDKIKR